MRDVSAIRRFNRFYTRQLGLLGDHLLESPFSLGEARVIYELAQREEITAADLSRELALDAGYLSRMLRSFERRGLVRRRRSTRDARCAPLSLTPAGRRAFATLDADARRDIREMLAGLGPSKRGRLVGAMHAIESVLGAKPGTSGAYRLRQPRPGDLGWVVQRHGELYAREYGWNDEFEGLVAGIVARFVRHRDPARERCWIAEREGENVGCIFCVKKSATVAQLRLLLVEPSARGAGIGARLVDECMAFARQAGFRSMVLWTNDVLASARRIYQSRGFELAAEENHHSFGHDLVGQNWRVRL